MNLTGGFRTGSVVYNSSNYALGGQSVELIPSPATQNLILTPPIEPLKLNQLKKGFILMNVMT
jgi:hypothetical protein